MSTLITTYGTNAGTVWQALHTNGVLDETRLKTITDLHEEDLYTAIGWLARENKIVQNPTGYSLGETNLVTTVGKNAGMIWRALDIWGEASAKALAHLARLQERDLYEALGWLAREGKLERTVKDQTQELVFRLR
jgi:hypothetical protein